MIIGFYLAEIFLFAKRDLEEQFFLLLVLKRHFHEVVESFFPH